MVDEKPRKNKQKMREIIEVEEESRPPQIKVNGQ